MLAVIGLITMVIMPCCPEKTDHPKRHDDGQQAHDFDQYADEPEPPEPVTKLLALLETCVNGQYVIGGQGDRVTKQFLANRLREKPHAFTKDQIEYLSRIAGDGEASDWDFPYHYAWDCSGLWWWGCNELGLYSASIDSTVYITYELYCTPISKDDLRPGDLLFYQNEKKRIVHMGIVGKKGYVFEAVSVFGGVVKRRTIDQRIYDDIAGGGQFKQPEWNAFGRPKIFVPLYD